MPSSASVKKRRLGHVELYRGPVTSKFKAIENNSSLYIIFRASLHICDRVTLVYITVTETTWSRDVSLLD